MQNRTDAATDLAGANGFHTEIVTTTDFQLRVFHRGLSSGAGKLHVYIEGDGNAWKGKYRLSRDPTPRNPLGLKLAISDPAAAVLYIARPCQFLPEPVLSRCSPEYWSTHRYSEEVIDAVNQVIEQKGSRFESFGLVGYSGGGSVAALVAARRDDVPWLITVAANLDHRAWTELHGVSPLEGSLNAVNYIDSLQHIPQIHFAGSRDEIVPVALLKAYRDAAGDPGMIHIIEIDDYDHTCCWVRNWQSLMCDYSPQSVAACPGTNPG